MEGMSQCPVCTLYLREGITLDAHLDTHPKDQVIKALCAFAAASASSSIASSRRSTSSSPFDLASGCSSESFGGRRFRQDVVCAPTPAPPPPPPPPPPPHFQPQFQAQFQAQLQPQLQHQLQPQLQPPHRMGFVVPAPRIGEVSVPIAPPAFGGLMLLKPYPAGATIISRRPFVAESPPARRPEPYGAPPSPGGLKILSNIKLESSASGVAFPAGRFSAGAPLPADVDVEGDEANLPDLERPDAAERPVADEEAAPFEEAEAPANALSVIKNVGNPAPRRDAAESPERARRVPSSPRSATTAAFREIKRPRRRPLPTPFVPRRRPFVGGPKRTLTIKSRIGRSAPTPEAAPEPPPAVPVDPPFVPREPPTKPEPDVDPGPDVDPDRPDVDPDRPLAPKDELVESPASDDGTVAYADPKVEIVDEDDRSPSPPTADDEGDADDRASEPEGVAPVNVIAYGGDPRAPSPVGSCALESRETIDETRDRGPYVDRDSVSSFSTADGPPVDGILRKIVVEVEFEKNCKRSEYRWNEPPQKEEFSFANFNRRPYGQCAYRKADRPDDEGRAGSLGEGVYSQLVRVEDDRKRSFADVLSSDKIANDDDALNIRTDERMPPRGELSEQESSGDVDAPWAGMYRDMVGSTSYDFIARESWLSDGSDVDMPSSPPKLIINEDGEDMPIVVSVKPPDKNYRCAACGKAFNCPKERRVHRTKEHSAIVGSDDIEDKKFGKKVFIKKTSVKIKKEKIVKLETNIPIMPPDMNIMEVHNMTMGFNMSSSINIDIEKTEVKNIPELLDAKLKLQFVRDLLKRQRRRDACCATCKVEFLTEGEYLEHLKIHPLECLTCGKLFNRRANLQLHIKRHLGIKNFRCDICEKRFITKQKLAEHYNIHTGRMPVKCTLCDMNFRRHSNMVQHRNQFHYHIKKRMRDYVCSCGEVFHSKKKLAWHKEIHDEKPKACLHCNEKFIHSASLTRHMRRTHNNYFLPDDKRQGENVQCTECNNVYLKSSIDMHMKTHTGSKPYSCVICNKSFTTNWNLKLHTWTHANRSSKPYKCALCKGAFIRHTDYVSHMNAHKSVRPYTCNHCGCQFIRKYNCQRHVKEHENEKKYVCEVPDCGKAFHRSYYLSEHLKVHSGVRPFACNICGKTSSTKTNHNKHLKIHHAREPITTEG